MLYRLLNWLTNQRAWHAENSRVWEPLSAPLEDGLSTFQHMATAALLKELPEISLVRAGQSETYLTGRVPSTEASVFIYLAGAEVLPDFYSQESEGTNDPDSLIREFVAAAKRAAAG